MRDKFNSGVFIIIVKEYLSNIFVQIFNILMSSENFSGVYSQIKRNM